MDVLNFFNQNPALISLIAFPLGLILLAVAAKGVGLGGLVKVMADHVAAEVKIENRLQEIVSEIKSLLSTSSDDRRYYDDKFVYFDKRLDSVDATLQHIITIIPKRKEERA